MVMQREKTIIYIFFHFLMSFVLFSMKWTPRRLTRGGGGKCKLYKCCQLCTVLEYYVVKYLIEHINMYHLVLKL